MFSNRLLQPQPLGRRGINSHIRAGLRDRNRAEKSRDQVMPGGPWQRDAQTIARTLRSPPGGRRRRCYESDDMRQLEAVAARPARSAGGAPQNVELRHLRYFVAVADAGSFTRAAERMFIAQPTLSQQLRRLEDIVGTRLLHRRREGVRLTAAGCVLLEASRAILRHSRAPVLAGGFSCSASGNVAWLESKPHNRTDPEGPTRGHSSAYHHRPFGQQTLLNRTVPGFSPAQPPSLCGATR